MIPALAIAAIAAVLFPVFSMLAKASCNLYNGTALNMTLFPALVGVAASLVCRKREPAASAAFAAGMAMVLVSAADLAWQGIFAPAADLPRMADRLEAHSARAIVSLFMGLGAGAVAALPAALAKRRAPARRGHTLVIAVAGLLLGLWACYGLAKFAQSSAPPQASEGSVQHSIDKLRNGTTAQMEQARLALIPKGSEAVQPLIECLDAPRGSTRHYAAKILGDIGDTRALEPLMALLRRSLAENRGNGPTSDQDALLAADVPNAIATAVEQITGNSFDGDPEKCLDWWTDRNRK